MRKLLSLLLLSIITSTTIVVKAAPCSTVESNPTLESFAYVSKEYTEMIDLTSCTPVNGQPSYARVTFTATNDISYMSAIRLTSANVPDTSIKVLFKQLDSRPTFPNITTFTPVALGVFRVVSQIDVMYPSTTSTADKQQFQLASYDKLPNCLTTSARRILSSVEFKSQKNETFDYNGPDGHCITNTYTINQQFNSYQGIFVYFPTFPADSYHICTGFRDSDDERSFSFGKGSIQKPDALFFLNKNEIQCMLISNNIANSKLTVKYDGNENVCSLGCLNCDASDPFSVSCDTCNIAGNFTAIDNGCGCEDGDFPYAIGDGSKCLPCYNSCEICSAEGCSKCRYNGGKNMFPNPDKSNSCIECRSDCKSCDVVGGCFECKDPGFNDGTTCQACADKCATCSVPGGCDSCNDTTLVPFNKECHTCGAGCSTCAIVGECDACKATDEYPDAATKTCKKCPLGCSSCSSSSQCTACRTGYQPSGSICTLITPICNPGCLNCFSNGQCTGCQAGFTLTDGKCILSATSCPVGCKICDDQKNCLTCEDNYVKDTTNTICKYNGACQSNCSLCNSATTCKTCLSGFVLVQGFCTPQPTACPAGCITCSSTNTCTKCFPTLTLANGACMTGTLATSCPEGCSDCTGVAPACKTCKTDYSLINGNPNALCLYTPTKCLDQCTSCTGPELCTGCKTGYTLYNGHCVKGDIFGICPGGCIECSNSKTCTKCRSNLELSSGKCINPTTNCPFGCKTCPTAKICSDCHYEFGLVDSHCVYAPASCTSNCRSCSGPFTCSVCSFGYSLINGLCVQGTTAGICPAGCINCSNPTTCTKCQPATTLKDLDTKKICAAANGCSFGCDNCSPTGKCLRCSNNFGLVDDFCYYTPEKCDENCATCSSPTTCPLCKTGYVSFNGLCVIGNDTCPAACFNCSSPTTCQNCQPETTLVNSNTCLDADSCPFGCKTCTDPGTSSVCTECDPDFGLFDFKCYYKPITCPSNCSSCVSSTHCTACATGYKFIGGYCVPGNKVCPAGCFQCNSEITCSGCEDGTTLTNNMCIKPPPDNCPLGCKTCSGTTCSECDSDFSLVGSSCYYTPASCPANCTSCSSADTCTTCATGFTFVGGKCIDGVNTCSAGCQVCSDPSTCSKCETGTTLSTETKKICIVDNCPAGCSDCSSNTVCSTCDSNHTLILGTCYYTPPTCPINCDSCTSPNTCPTCNPGTIFSNGKCNLPSDGACAPGCLDCSSISSCTTCQGGLQLVDGYCKDPKNNNCTFGCTTCNGNTCTGCQNNFTSNNGLCIFNDGVACPSGCSKCNSPQTCTICTTGFTFTGGYCLPGTPICSAGCIDCPNLQECQACGSGLTLSNGYCVIPPSVCPFGCSSCQTNSNICSDCSSDFVLFNNLCYYNPPTSCPNGCSACSSSTQCTTCQTGFTFVGGYCIERTPICPGGCYKCSNPTTCENCFNTFTLTNGYCVDPADNCPVGCATCSNLGVCSSCDVDYNLYQGFCLYNPPTNSCPTGCSSCSSATVCTVCTDTTFSFIGGECSAGAAKFALQTSEKLTYKPDEVEFRLFLPFVEGNVNYEALKQDDAFTTEITAADGTTARRLQSTNGDAVNTSIKKDPKGNVIVNVKESGYEDGDYTATVTPKKGVFDDQIPFKVNMTLTNEKTNKEKLQELCHTYGKMAGYVMKVVFIASILLKIILDLVFKDLESQAFLIWLIVAMKMLNRLRYIDVNFGIATQSFFNNLGDLSLTIAVNKETIQDNTFGVGNKFYQYEIPHIPLYSMPLVSWFYPLMFIIKIVLSVLCPTVVRLGLKKRLKESGSKTEGFFQALISYYFLKLYFILFIISVVDIFFYSIRAMLNFEFSSSSTIGKLAYLHALVLIIIASIDIEWLLFSIVRINDSYLVYRIWRGCFFYTGSRDHNEDAYGVDNEYDEDLDSGIYLAPESGYDSFRRVWQNNISALALMGETPYSNKGGLANFSYFGFFESVYFFARMVLFNIIMVSLKSNIAISMLMLIVLEFIKVGLQGYKGIGEQGITFLQRIRMFAGVFESLAYVEFYLMTLYCYQHQADQLKNNSVPFEVQFISMIAVCVILFTMVLTLLISVIQFFLRIIYSPQLQGGHFDPKTDFIRKTLKGILISAGLAEEDDEVIREPTKPSQISIEPNSDEFDKFDMGSRLSHDEFRIKEEGSLQPVLNSNLGEYQYICGQLN